MLGLKISNPSPLSLKVVFFFGHGLCRAFLYGGAEDHASEVFLNT